MKRKYQAIHFLDTILNVQHNILNDRNTALIASIISFNEDTMEIIYQEKEQETLELCYFLLRIKDSKCFVKEISFNEVLEISSEWVFSRINC